MYFESAAKPFMFGWYQRTTDPAPLFYDGEENRQINSRFRWASPETWMTINNYCDGSQIINCNNVSQPYGFHPGGILISSARRAGRVLRWRRSTPTCSSRHVTMAGDEIGP